MRLAIQFESSRFTPNVGKREATYELETVYGGVSEMKRETDVDRKHAALLRPLRKVVESMHSVKLGSIVDGRKVLEIDYDTTENGLVERYRLAGENQWRVVR